MSGVEVSKNEVVWERIYGSRNVLRYVVTSDRRREWYALYAVDGAGNWERIKKASTPVELRRLYHV